MEYTEKAVRAGTSPVTEAFDSLRKSSDNVGILLNTLRDKLQPVLLDHNPNGGTVSTPQPPEPLKSELVQSIDSQARILRAFGSQLEALIDQCQL